GSTLSVGPGCVLILSPGVNLTTTNSSLTLTGTVSSLIHLLPADTSPTWGGVIASGTSAHLLGQHLEMIGGHVELFDGATGVVEDSYIHHYEISSPAIVHTFGSPNHVSLDLRRCHIAHY